MSSNSGGNSPPPADGKSATGTSNRSAAQLSEEERTLPKRFKSVDPDVTVVVGGVEFYHYKTIMCSRCEFFDNMFSAGMRESKDNRIEFPDKNPDEWIEIYKLLSLEGSELRKEIEGKINPTPFHIHKANQKTFTLIFWFDYLGLCDVVEICDQVAAGGRQEHYQKRPHEYPAYSDWVTLKYLPCPLLLAVVKEQVKSVLFSFKFKLAPIDPKVFSHVQKYLLDDQCGEESWALLVSKAKFPDEMLEKMDRETIVTAPLFKYLIEMAYDMKPKTA
jgi:hypothetical protein